MLKKISLLSQVKPPKNWLTILDIDDTIMKYKDITSQWWNKKTEDYYISTNCKVKAYQQALDEWKTHIRNNEPTHVDKYGMQTLISKIKKTNDKMILVTYRSQDLYYPTTQHLEKLGIKYDDIYMTAGASKGDQINKILFKYEGIKGIVFVDDKKSNIMDVIGKVELPLKCYHIVHDTN